MCSPPTHEQSSVEYKLYGQLGGDARADRVAISARFKVFSWFVASLR